MLEYETDHVVIAYTRTNQGKDIFALTVNTNNGGLD